MIAANEESEVGRNAGSAVVLVEIADSSIFLWYGHAVEVIVIADCLSLLDVSQLQSRGKSDLEVAANDEEVNGPPIVDFTGLLDGGVYSVESAMTLTLCQLGPLIVRRSLTQPSIAMRIFLSTL